MSVKFQTWPSTQLISDTKTVVKDITPYMRNKNRQEFTRTEIDNPLVNVLNKLAVPFRGILSKNGWSGSILSLKGDTLLSEELNSNYSYMLVSLTCKDIYRFNESTFFLEIGQTLFIPQQDTYKKGILNNITNRIKWARTSDSKNISNNIKKLYCRPRIKDFENLFIIIKYKQENIQDIKLNQMQNNINSQESDHYLGKDRFEESDLDSDDEYTFIK